MQGVAAGLHSDVDDTPRGLPELGGEGGSLDLELLDGVDDGLDNLSGTLVEANDAILVLDAVKQITILDRTRTVGDEVVAFRRPGGWQRTGAERGELNEVAAVERQLVDTLLFDYLT